MNYEIVIASNSEAISPGVGDGFAIARRDMTTSIFKSAVAPTDGAR
ncbi:MAG: hypothetical protein H6631_03640 [Anaerolineaceae bacterium]|nr:hypothetical protein [Anaerolineaceae bacterium]MCB9101992.1 hypothetical protein [Anaerolineales bacterium]